jgi:DNA-binding transcriptional ArsR family regulator
MMTLTSPFPHRCNKLDLASPVDPADEGIAQMARGLAHPTRIAIMRQLSNGEPLAAGEIVTNTGLAQSTVSVHLRFLRDAQLISAQKVGSRVWYRRRRSVLANFAQAIEDLGDN